MPSELTVLTVATNACVALDNWKLSLAANGYGNVKIVGLSQKWRGFDWRSRMYLKHLKLLAQKYGDRHIVMTSDSTDVIFMQSQSMLLDKFKSFKQDVVISGESSQNVGQFYNATSRDMAQKVVEKRFNPGTVHIWINAGLCIGYVSSMIRLYERIQQYDDDQEGIQMEWMSDPTLCHVDSGQILFTAVNGIHYLGKKETSGMLKEIEFAGNDWRQVITNAYPCVMHFPGKVTSTYNVYVNDWQMHLKKSSDAWQHKLQEIPSRNMGGLWQWKFTAKTILKAYSREVKSYVVFVVAMIVLLVLHKVLRKR